MIERRELWPVGPIGTRGHEGLHEVLEGRTGKLVLLLNLRVDNENIPGIGSRDAHLLHHQRLKPVCRRIGCGGRTSRPHADDNHIPVFRLGDVSHGLGLERHLTLGWQPALVLGRRIHGARIGHVRSLGLFLLHPFLLSSIRRTAEHTRGTQKGRCRHRSFQERPPLNIRLIDAMHVRLTHVDSSSPSRPP